jgi:hypothetical protein
MRKLLVIAAPVALTIGVCGMLKADDPTTAPSYGQSHGWGSVDATIKYNEFLEQNVRLAKDADATGVEAVIYAAAMFHDKEPQAQIDFLTKALQNTKSRPVQREIRLELFRKYRQEEMDDKALDQLQQLMMDQ